ncbi:MAG TPA: T9SS type A sorting domain-containing protein, partial [Puia sp.]|nr:T9SS type A sorting domain-containing protein [Puia sp.]
NSSMTSNGNVFTTVSLIANSRIQIGNGSLTSDAIYTMNGPTMVVYDNSAVAVANQNNVFYNQSDYLYLASTSSSIFTAKINSTSGANLNCGAGYANPCSANSLYGPASVASSVTPVVTLPVILEGFTANLSNLHTVTLNWHTQMEVNFSHFTIQRSGDGANWEDIGTVQAKGNSEVAIDYSFTDAEPLTGANCYRLALVNLDDSYTYSDVKVVEVQEATAARISFYPNPARDFLNVSLGGENPGRLTVLLTSFAGQLMQEKAAVTGSGSVVTFPIQNMAAGMYVLTIVHADGSRESSPVMITH